MSELKAVLAEIGPDEHRVITVLARRPEAAPGFRDKDQVENTLHARVCSGAMALEAALRAIAMNWTAVH